MNFDRNYLLLKEDTKDLSNSNLENLKELKIRAQKVLEEYDNLQLVIKGDANSIYGSCGNAYFSMRDYDIATDITVGAKHFAIIVDIAINNFFKQWADNEDNINKIHEIYPNVVKLRNFTEYKRDTVNDLCVYGDTDSRYVDIEMIYHLMEDENGIMQLPEDNEELSKFSEFLMDNFISKIIKDTIDEDCEFRNARKGYLKMAHEVTTRKCSFIKKKKYIMTVVYEDGKLLKKPKFKFKGVELKRGSTSPSMKKILNKLVEKFLIEEYTIEEIRRECLKIIKYLKQTKKKENIYLITTVSGFKNIELKDGVYTSSKNHIQMQIALSWMNFIKENNLQKDYKFPFEGQKMNYYKCPEGSKYKVIGVPDDVDIDDVPNLPEPDWNEMIRASFIKPLLRYIIDNDDVTDNDCDNFLMGFTKKISF